MLTVKDSTSIKDMINLQYINDRNINLQVNFLMLNIKFKVYFLR